MAISMPTLSSPYALLCPVLLLALFLTPASAFGAGNIAAISAIEGQNWRHGDIEDTLLNILLSRAAGGKKFTKLDVKRVYFGNWLRDYSQAVDVGTVKYVSAEAIRLILWVLGFMSFGYGTKEFEVTTERLGCYRPEEHIDNPKDYADNLDARQYDRRLRGPVDERRELAINPQTGLKNYIASENAGMATSAGLVRNLYGRCIQLGRQYNRSRNKADLYEAFRLMGTANHCLEDYTAHSNYCELVLIELGERGVFPHVGRQTQLNLPGARHPVYPIVTGTFGGVDFLHSVMGEFSDKATQSELQELEGTIQSSESSGKGNVSILQDILNKVPSGLFGDKDQAGKADELQSNAQAAQLQNTHITPRQPEEWANQLQEVSKQIYPILEWHDEIMQSITETIEKIPILPELIEQLQDEINVFVFTLLAPFVLPIINQVKTELATGSSEVIQSSRDKQLIVFHDDRSTDPTHSMLSKDHFSNILNEPAGKTASQVLKWVVPQVIACWDDERIDVNRTLNRIISGVFHHPALVNYGEDGAVDGRRLMFNIVRGWWEQKDNQEKEILRDQLSRDGVEQGRNHKDGVQDSGHGCGKPLGMPNAKTAGSSGATGGAATGSILGEISSALAGQSQYDPGAVRPSPGGPSASFGKFAEEAVGGGALGGIVEGLTGGLGGDLLGDVLGGSKPQKQSYQTEQYGREGDYTQKSTEFGYEAPQRGQQQRYGQAEYNETSFPGGGQRQEYQRYAQGGLDQPGYGEQVIRETRPTYEGGYNQTSEVCYERSGGAWESNVRHEERASSGRLVGELEYQRGDDSYKRDSDSDGERKKKHKHKKHHKHHSGSSSEEEEGGYGENNRSYGRQEPAFEGRDEGFGSRPAFESRSFGNEGLGERRRAEFEPGLEREGQSYGRGEFESQEGFGGGFGGRNEYGGGGRGFGGEDEVERTEERIEDEFGGDRGYGGGEEYQERRGYGDDY